VLAPVLAPLSSVSAPMSAPVSAPALLQVLSAAVFVCSGSFSCGSSREGLIRLRGSEKVEGVEGVRSNL
jgi:hypothetical protein